MVGCNHCASDNSSEIERADPHFRKVLWFALVANALMFVVELVAAWFSHSISLQADALDFFGDAVNYAVSLLVLGMSLAARAKAALFKGATMALFGLWVIGSALYRVFYQQLPDPVIMGGVGFLALLVNVVVALLLFRYRGGDSNKRSIWLCSRNDALGNLAVMLAAAGVFASASAWPDLLVAGLIALLNLSASVQVLRQARAELRSL